MSRLLAWLDARFPLISTWKKHASEYYVPKNLNFLYCFGALAVVALVIQFFSGLWLTMFYMPSVKQAFQSVEYVMREVNYGWFLRYLHSTGASAVFIVIYVHVFRALLYGSYQKPRELVWLLGMGLLFLLIIQAFFGYLLPWGQLSYWGAQVMTSLIEAIPYVGDSLALWIRGDYKIGEPTLQRFFALHIMGIPFLILLLIFLHLVSLHKVGSNNPQGIDIKKHLDKDGIPFHPYYTSKDSVAILIFLLIFSIIVFFFPEMGGYFLEPANFTPANPLVTPDDIKPIWYLTPFYSMLRAIPDKLGGVIVMASALMMLLFLPWLDKSPVRSMRYKGIFSRLALAGLVISFCLSGYLGTLAVTPLRQLLARCCLFFYFTYFLLMPFYTRWETCKPLPDRIE